MASYKGHNAINLLLILPLSFVCLHFGLKKPLSSIGYFSAGFTYATFFMSPDMDLARQIRLFSLRGFLTYPFRLYSRIFRHRGISHHFLFGTLTRVAWMLAWILGAMMIFYSLSVSTSTLRAFFIAHQEEIILSLWGILIADASHVLVDRF